MVLQLIYDYFLILDRIGWPSFTDVSEKGSVVKIEDKSHGMVRIEAACAKVSN